MKPTNLGGRAEPLDGGQLTMTETRAQGHTPAYMVEKLNAADALCLDRLPTVLKLGGVGRSKIYSDIQKGLWPAPVRIGRSSAWPHHEVQALLAARIANATDQQLRVLVREMVERRAEMMPTLERVSHERA